MKSMKIIKSIMLTTFLMLTAFSGYAEKVDFGDNNKPYQACFKACADDDAGCYTDINTNVRAQSFSYEVQCHNKVLECQFGCKDKYNVQ
jgi:hypothetical protein